MYESDIIMIAPVLAPILLKFDTYKYFCYLGIGLNSPFYPGLRGFQPLLQGDSIKLTEKWAQSDDMEFSDGPNRCINIFLALLNSLETDRFAMLHIEH